MYAASSSCGRDVVKEAPQEPDRNGDGEREKGDDEAGVRVDEPEARKDAVDRDDDRRKAEHLAVDDQREEELPAGELQAGKTVRAQEGDEDGDHRGDHRHAEAVQEVAEEGGVLQGLLEVDQRHAVREEADRQRKLLLGALEGGGEHLGEGEQDEEQDDRDRHGPYHDEERALPPARDRCGHQIFSLLKIMRMYWMLSTLTSRKLRTAKREAFPKLKFMKASS